MAYAWPHSLGLMAGARPNAVLLCGVAAVALVLWRLWKFTLRPRFYPLEPKELPYWIPFLGHVAGFASNVNSVFEEGRRYFKDSPEPYCITAAGTTYYVVTDPLDVSRLHRDTAHIEWSEIIKEMHRMLGFSPKGMDTMFSFNASVGADPLSGKQLDVNHMIRSRWRDQLHPGDKFHSLKKKVTSSIRLRLEQSFAQQSGHANAQGSASMSLLDVSLNVVGGALIDNIYGPELRKVCPSILRDIDEWERCMWKQLFKFPKVFCGDAIAYRDKIIDVFAKYYALPSEARAQAAPVIEEMRLTKEKAGFQTVEMGGVALLYLWGVAQNIHKTAFWAFARVAHDKALAEALLREVTPALQQSTGEIDDDFLSNKCPKLESLFYETLRFSMRVFLPRDVTQTTVVGGKTMLKGGQILIPVTQLHHNRRVWGDSPEQFNFERFAEDPKLSKSLSLRPFGAGLSLCPGRFLAKKVVAHFVANMLLRYDFELLGREGDQAFPRYKRSIPTGISGAVDGDDVLIAVRPKHA